jgi:predicted AlkP superfamily phosphohydrolase/phosphomutase
MGSLVFKPEEIYANVRGVAPDLIVHFGALSWRSIGGVGYPGLHIQENDTGPDDCNHAQHGSFILAAAGSPLKGEIADAHIMQMAPALLELGGYDVPTTMQGTSLLAGQTAPPADGGALSPDGEEIIRERLSGLGYIS